MEQVKGIRKTVDRYSFGKHDILQVFMGSFRKGFLNRHFWQSFHTIPFQLHVFFSDSGVSGRERYGELTLVFKRGKPYKNVPLLFPY